MLETTIDDQILIAKLTHGPTNSITRETLDQLKKAVEQVTSDDNLKGLILTGDGRFFSSGFDLYTFMNFKNREEAVEFLSYADQVLLDFFLCPKAVVCAMNGHSAAGGLILAMASDYRIISDHPKVKVGMSEIKIGVPLSVAQSAVMRFGLDSDKRFRDVMYFGEMIDPKTALEREIVDQTVEADKLIETAKFIIALWMDTPGRPFRYLKKELKMETGRRIKARMAETDWHQALDCFTKKEVKDTLAFVQSTMEPKPTK